MMGSAGGVVDGETYWILELNGGSSTTVSAVTSDSSGNIYAVGSCTDGGTLKIFTVKCSKTGSLLWQRFITPGAFGNAYGICVDSNNDIYITGVAGSSNQNVLVAKYTSTGALTWQRYFSGPSVGSGLDISVDSSNNIYVVGTNNADRRATYFKINSSGTLLLTGSESLNTDGIFDAGIVATSSGNIYSTSFIKPSSGTQYTYIVKRNSSLTIQWERRLGASANEFGYSVDLDSSENVYIAAGSLVGGNSATIMAKYNSSGVIQWQKALTNPSGFGSQYGIALTGAGTSYCATLVTSGSIKAFVYSRDTSGTIQWQRSLDISSANIKQVRFTDCALNGADSLVTCGSSVTDVFTGTTYRGLIVKLPTDGSKTGTYGSYTYAATTLTDVTSTLAEAATTTFGSTTNSSSTPTLPEAAGTLTSSIITL